MIKSMLSILMIILLSGANIALGQESNLYCPETFKTINSSETCSVDTRAERFRKSLAARELSSKELDQIVGEGPGSFLVYVDSQTGSLVGIILWDEISKRTNSSMAGSIAMESGGSLMHGIQVNGIIK